MKKPSFIWSLLVLCVVLVISALAWQSVRLLSMEKSQALAEVSSEVEGYSRLALARIDSAAANFLIDENRRPISEFRSFNENGTASRLLTEEVEFIHLHFEMDEQKNLNSPQVVADTEKPQALALGTEEGRLEDDARRLEILRAMLISQSDEVDQYTDQFTDMARPSGKPSAVWSAPKLEVIKQNIENISQATPSYKKTKEYQQDRNYVEKGSRAKSVSKALSKATQEVASEYRQGQLDIKNSLTPSASSDSEGVSLSIKDDSEGLDAVYPMQAIWIGDELFIVRRVELRNEVRYQGAWLKTEALRTYFESLVKDLLPDSRLEPVLALLDGSATDDAMTLVSLPFRLVPNADLQVAMPPWSPMRSSLLVSWIAALVSIGAVALLIRSILRLSERRASFVSAVTHELRTPLTTFKLYSEMLADGMVKDETKKKQYLDTMKDEADRLSHLVENVLSYSKIERGSARVSQETINVSAMLSRFSQRLEERVETEGAEFHMENHCEDIQLSTDVTAVEQILFNLIDNACKYGLPKEGKGNVSLTVSKNGDKEVVFRVIDQGRGIKANEESRLFKAFHKSAYDAANDKPGVGLGLSLCRGTAKQLGGSLTLEKRQGQGSVFALTLPTVKKA